MFEKYDAERLFHCEIDDMIPYYVENLGGCIFITGEKRESYNTVVYLNSNNKYVDINNPRRIINVIDSSSDHFPLKSRDFHLYSINLDSIRKYNDKSISKTLRKVPFVGLI